MDAYTAAIRRTDGVQPSGRVRVAQVTGEFPTIMTLSNTY